MPSRVAMRPVAAPPAHRASCPRPRESASMYESRLGVSSVMPNIYAVTAWCTRRFLRNVVDVTLLCLAAFVVWTVLHTWLDAPDESPAALLDVGSVLAFDGSTQWTEGATRNVVLRGRGQCRACSDSELFYRRLATVVSASPHARLIIISEDSVAETRQWIELAGISVDVVHQWSDGIEMYPVIYMTDNRGVVTNIWLGKLNPQEEETLLAMVRNEDVIDEGSGAGLPSAIDEGELARLKERSIVTVIDPRERRDVGREIPPDAINIPMSEWPSRLPAEFERDDVLVLDCTFLTPLDCQASSIALKGAFDYINVYRLDL